MSKLNKNYIDSHWLLFAFKGAAALVFGWIFLFGTSINLFSLIPVVGIFLLIFSVIEFFNTLYRAHKSHEWLISLLIAVFDCIAALIILFTQSSDITVPYITISAYTFLRGVIEIIFAFMTIDDSTDRFTWLLTGLCGAIMGIVIFNSANIEPNPIICFFGSYVSILGVSNLIYGFHNRNQKLDAISEKKSTKKTKSTQKSTKSSSKKSSPKTTKKSKSRR